MARKPKRKLPEVEQDVEVAEAEQDTTARNWGLLVLVIVVAAVVLAVASYYLL